VDDQLGGENTLYIRLEGVFRKMPRIFLKGLMMALRAMTLWVINRKRRGPGQGASVFFVFVFGFFTVKSFAFLYLHL